MARDSAPFPLNPMRDLELLLWTLPPTSSLSMKFIPGAFFFPFWACAFSPFGGISLPPRIVVLSLSARRPSCEAPRFSPDEWSFFRAHPFRRSGTSFVSSLEHKGPLRPRQAPTCFETLPGKETPRPRDAPFLDGERIPPSFSESRNAEGN